MLSRGTHSARALTTPYRVLMAPPNLVYSSTFKFVWLVPTDFPSHISQREEEISERSAPAENQKQNMNKFTIPEFVGIRPSGFCPPAYRVQLLYHHQC